jgi:hypothetical protein
VRRDEFHHSDGSPRARRSSPCQRRRGELPLLRRPGTRPIRSGAGR